MGVQNEARRLAFCFLHDEFALRNAEECHLW
jgi:hypothetical protein